VRRAWIAEVSGHVYDVSLLSDKEVLATNENKVLIIHEGNVAPLYVHEAPVYKARKEGGALILAAEDKKLLIVAEGDVKSVELEYGLFSLAVKGSKVAAGGCCGAIYLLENYEVKKSLSVGGHVYDLEWGKYLYAASFDGSLYAFDNDLNLVKRVDLAENVNVVRSCGDLVAAGTFEPGGVFVMDADLNLLWSKGGYLDVRMVAWRQNCEGLYVGSWDGEFSLFTKDGKEVLRGKGPRGIESGAWKDGRLVIGGWNRVELYEEEGNEFEDSEEAPQPDHES